MAITSTVLANGQQSDITHYNNLRSDLLTEHDHSTGKGGTVSHGDLSDGVISGTYTDHDAINTHVQGTGTSSDPDDPGGSQGVHGLPSTAYVMGCLSSQLVMQSGTGTTDSTLVVDGSYVDQYEDITFPAAFSGTPKVFVMSNDSNSARIGATSITTSGFRALIGFPFGSKATSQYSAQFMWIAVGVLA